MIHRVFEAGLFVHLSIIFALLWS